MLTPPVPRPPLPRTPTAGAGLNLAHEAVDRHALGDRAALIALRCIGLDGGVRELSYAELKVRTDRFAAWLQLRGCLPGDRVFLLLGRVPELYVAALGALKAGCVLSPLFPAFGPEPIHQRLSLGSGRVLITTPSLYRRKVAGLRSRLPDLEIVALVGAGGEPTPPEQRHPDTVDLAEALSAVTGPPQPVHTDPESPALLHFTSGTTGQPKGALHVHGAGVHHAASARAALDLGPDDRFWCTADPGWVTGMSYGILAPLLIGCTNLVYEGDFDPLGWLALLRAERVTVWYTAPTAIRMLMRAGVTLDAPLPDLRLMASVGEPLNPEAVRWGRRVFGLDFHDTWWQTETGGILLASPLDEPVRPGAMGRPLPGILAGLVHEGADGAIEVLEGGDVEGELAFRPGWPSMFREYLGQPERYARCFADGWYLTGDRARRDSDGFYWFVGRTDDVINTAGHLVGPFEVESALLEHPAVAEAAAIGVPDPVAMEVVKAYVALKPGHNADEALRRELLGLARRRLGPAVAPREIAFRDVLPKTRSGKIMRRLLKARELGLPEGDTSTLLEGR